MNIHLTIRLLFLPIFLAFFTDETRAAQGNQRNILPGGRAAAMGGAYTALADDASGLYYNPAGLHWANNRGFSLTGNAFGTTQTTYLKTVADKSFVESSSSTFPNLIGSTYTLGPIKYGYAYITKNSRGVNQNDSFSNISSDADGLNYFTRQYLELDSNIWVGGGAALGLGQVFSVGFSPFYYHHSKESLDHQYVKYNNGNFKMLGLYYNRTNLGLVNIAGLLIKLGPLRLGASAWNTTPLKNSTEYKLTKVEYVSGQEPTNTAQGSNNDWDIDEMIPITSRIGLAIEFGKNFLITSDAIIHQGRIDQTSVGEVTLLDTTNTSLGLEISMGNLVLRSGVYTNLSMYPDIDQTKTGQPTKIDFHGIAFSIGYSGRDYQIDLGSNLQTGKGKSQKISGSTDTQDVVAHSGVFTFSGSYSL